MTMRRFDEAVSVFIMLALISSSGYFVLANGVQILSKSKLEKCEKTSDSNDNLNCTRKIVLNMAVPSGTSGREASIVAEIVEVEQNSANKMQTLRIPPVIAVNKSAVFALYELTYIRDVPYKPQEFYVKTRKCEPDADAKVVQICERLRDESGNALLHTEPVCCPCGDRRRVPSSCGNFFDKITKGKANTAHCLRFSGDWFHVFAIGRRSIGFSVRIEVKTESKISEVIVGPENQTATSSDNFLRVNLVGDFAGYTNIPAFEDFYLVTPRQGEPGQPQNLGRNLSMWMLLERVRFTLDGLECNKIGVSYEAFNGQPDFCSAPFWSCLHNQLWNFHEADVNRIKRHQGPLYGIERRYERINEHPDAGPQSFSVGITEVLNTNLLIELRADDIEYVYQRSPGKILGIAVPAFEALAQSGIAKITTKNVGELEASYSLTFECSKGVTMMEEQFFIMKPQEAIIRSFTLNPMTDQAAKYACSAILKDSEFNEVDRAECQFTTTATALDNGTEGPPFEPPKSNTDGFFDYIKRLWKKIWDGLMDFVTGKSCRSKCSGFFDFGCHIQYVCLSWVVMFGIFLAVFPTVLVLIWLLHQKGLFDPCYDWWEDHCYEYPERYKPHRHNHYQAPHERYHKHGHRHYRDDGGGGGDVLHKQHRRIHGEHRQSHLARENDYHHYLHHVHKDKHKHGHHRSTGGGAGHREEVVTRLHRHRKERKAIKQPANLRRQRKAVDCFDEEFDGMLDRHTEMHRHRMRRD